MSNWITYFTALVPFGLVCRLQNPAYIGHCPGMGSSHGIISWWVACSRRSGERRMQGASESRETYNNLSGIERKIILWIARWGDRGEVGGGGELITTWISPGGGVLPYKRLMGMCRWMGSHFQRVSMGWWILRLSAKILALLRLSLNFFQLRLTKS